VFNDYNHSLICCFIMIPITALTSTFPPHYCFESDLSLHELAFEEDVLPDRTKVSYIQIRWTSQLFYLINWICFLSTDMLWAEIVGLLKKGYEIFCTCCSCKVNLLDLVRILLTYFLINYLSIYLHILLSMYVLETR
jgi:hypothetical protein